MLLEHFPEHPETTAALATAAADKDADLRMFAATQLRESEVFAAVVRDLTVKEDVRAEALRQYLEANTGARGIAIAERLLFDPSALVRAQAITVVGRARRKENLARLLELGNAANHRAEQLALAEAYWRLGDPGAEVVLVKLLGAEDAAVRIECARALGRIGGVAAVAPLRKVQGLLSGELGTAAEDAIAAIQSRLRGAAEGQITLAEEAPRGGRVSVATGQGAVSLPGKPRKGG
jgi:HEAT repeat protein